MVFWPGVVVVRCATVPSGVARVTKCIRSSSWARVRQVLLVAFSMTRIRSRASQHSCTWARIERSYKNAGSRRSGHFAHRKAKGSRRGCPTGSDADTSQMRNINDQSCLPKQWRGMVAGSDKHTRTLQLPTR